MDDARRAAHAAGESAPILAKAPRADLRWAALHELRDYHATIADIRQGIIDYEQGHGEPLPAAMADIRQQLGFRL